MNKDKLIKFKNRFKKTVKDNAPEIAAFGLSVLGAVVAAKLIKKTQKATVHAGDISSIRTGSQSVYSFCGSPLHLVLDDGIAERYNRFINEFLDAQGRYKDKYGKKWEPNKALPMQTNKNDHKAYDVVGRLINYMIGINGGSLSIPEEQCTSDILEKLQSQDLSEPSH